MTEPRFSIHKPIQEYFEPVYNAGFIQSIPVSNSTPGDGFMISYDNTNHIFSFTDPGGSGGGINADKIRGTNIDPNLNTGILSGQVLTYSGTEWKATDPTTDAKTIQGKPVSQNAPSNLQVLAYNGSEWIPTTLTSANSLWKSTTGVLELVTPSDASTGVVFPLGSLDQVGATDIKFLFDSLNGSIRAGQVTGGYWDTANRGTASVGFGYNSQAIGDYGVIGGGSYNSIQEFADYSVICGGGGINLSDGNIIKSYGITSFIGGGSENVIEGKTGNVLVGGTDNKIELLPLTDPSGNCFIGAGSGNRITIDTLATNAASQAFIGAGVNNLISSPFSVIVGGGVNKIEVKSSFSFIGGGTDNTITGTGATISDPCYSFIGGGESNTITGNLSFIGGGGGTGNAITGNYSFIGGGDTNNVIGDYGTIPGGRNCSITTHDGCFVWNGSSTLTETTGSNQCIMRATSQTGSSTGTTPATAGFYFLTGTDNNTGAALTFGTPGWTISSDRNKKENLIEYDSDIALKKVESLPIYSYNMIGSDSKLINIGPMAQDWNELFVSTKDKLSISSVDLHGVAFAAIKGLLKKVKELEARIDMLEAP
jgi:hypothetical protein